MMPTSLPSSTTGNRRMSFCCMSFWASVMSVLLGMVTTLARMKRLTRMGTTS